jgi:hypothetical protein
MIIFAGYSPPMYYTPALFWLHMLSEKYKEREDGKCFQTG